MYDLFGFFLGFVNLIFRGLCKDVKETIEMFLNVVKEKVNNYKNLIIIHLHSIFFFFHLSEIW